MKILNKIEHIVTFGTDQGHKICLLQHSRKLYQLISGTLSRPLEVHTHVTFVRSSVESLPLNYEM